MYLWFHTTAGFFNLNQFVISNLKVINEVLYNSNHREYPNAINLVMA